MATSQPHISGEEPTRTRPPDPLQILGLAVAQLDEGRHGDVEATVHASTVDLGPAGAALALTALGLRIETEGRNDEAIMVMERAYVLDIPLPSLLRAQALFFERHRRPLIAHHLSLQLDLLDSGALPAHFEVIPPSNWARHAPRVIRRRLDKGESMTYEVAPLKQALADRIGSAAATIIVAGIDDGEAWREVAVLPLVPLLDHARTHGRDYEEWTISSHVPSRPARVFEHEPGPRYDPPTRVFFTCVLEGVTVGARSNLLLLPGAALLDFQGAELARDPVLAVDPLVVAREGLRVYVTRPPVTQATRIPEAVWLTGVHSAAFGHWLIEFLPKVWALIDRPRFANVPILIDAGMPSQHEESLRLFVGPEHPIVTLGPRQHVNVERLWVASQLVYLATGPKPGTRRLPTVRGLDDDGFRRLMSRARDALGPIAAEGAPPRIYLIRQADQHRRLVNAPAVEAVLSRHDFEALDFGKMSFADQVRHVVGAEHVVGQDGSALLMTMFGRPGLRVGGLAQPQLAEWDWYADTSEALGHVLTVILGRLADAHARYSWMSDYEIDIGALERYLAPG